jgi:hypothetical protein
MIFFIFTSCPKNKDSNLSMVDLDSYFCGVIFL